MSTLLGQRTVASVNAN